MSCRYLDDLTPYIEQRLSALRMESVKEHLRACAECRTVDALIRRTTRPMEMPEHDAADQAREAVLRSMEEQTSLLYQLNQFFRKKDGKQ